MTDTFSRCWFDEGLVCAAGGISRFAQGVKVALVTRAKPLLASILICRLFLEFLVRKNLQTRVTGQEEYPGYHECFQWVLQEVRHLAPCRDRLHRSEIR